MEIQQIFTALGLAVTLVILLFCVIDIYYRLKRHGDLDQSFKQIIKYLLFSGFISDAMVLLNMLISSASGGWSLGFVSCEVLGFVSTTMIAFTAWLLTIAIFERYVAILSPMDLSSTFSQRNIRIISVGLFLLILMAATGPFYAFGEYTYLRGYLNIIVSTNISLSGSLNKEESLPDMKLDSLYQLFGHLKRSSYESSSTNMLSTIALHLHQHYDVIVSKSKWLSHGILFSIRAFSTDTLDSFMDHYHEQMLTANITDLSFIEDIANTLNISDTEVTAHISYPEYLNYRNNYLPVQDLGICAVDNTSPSNHSSVWIGFYVSIVFILPYSASLTGLCSIYIRGFIYSSYAAKRASDLDVSITNITSTVCMTSCVLNLIYFITILLNSDGRVFSSSTMFWVTYVISLKTLPLVLSLKLGLNTCKYYCTCCNTFLKLFRCRSSNELSYELSELEMTQSLTGKQKRTRTVT